MLSRAFTTPRKKFRFGEGSFRSSSIHEYEGCIIGFMEDQPLNPCHGNDGGHDSVLLTLGEVLRGSVGVVGESRLGMIEKVVLRGGKVCSLKRFRKVSVRKIEFGRRIERLAEISSKSQYLVPLTSYLYTKRVKFVASDYFPMGSLADLLAGARELGHTALDWKQRFKIVCHIARGIAFIHRQSPQQDKQLTLNIHGNLKSSNIMINNDFGACISDYGFIQLAERGKDSDIWRGKPPPVSFYCQTLSQKSDAYNFGVIVLDLLGGPQAPGQISCIVEKRSEIGNGLTEFFEFPMKGKERRQALRVLDIALELTNNSPDVSRRSMERISRSLDDIFK